MDILIVAVFLHLTYLFNHLLYTYYKKCKVRQVANLDLLHHATKNHPWCAMWLAENAGRLGMQWANGDLEGQPIIFPPQDGDRYQESHETLNKGMLSKILIRDLSRKSESSMMTSALVMRRS